MNEQVRRVSVEFRAVVTPDDDQRALGYGPTIEATITTDGGIEHDGWMMVRDDGDVDVIW